MAKIDQNLIFRLVRHLRTLPNVEEREERHQSWMTAEQIGQWSKSTLTAEQLDELLLEWWEENRSRRRIRPAKYPDLTTGMRLWGHVENVGPAPKYLEPRLKAEPLVLEHLDLNWNAPQVFVSYSFRDVHLAARMRLTLGSEYGFRAWLASEMLEKEGLIFEGVRAALDSSAWIVILLTRHSLGSAWIDTEANTALGLSHVGGSLESDDRVKKPIVFVADANDSDLLNVLGSLSPDLELMFAPVYLDPLLVAFSRVETEAHRCVMYRVNAERILGLARHYCPFALYPRCPPSLERHPNFKDFIEVVRRLSPATNIGEGFEWRNANR